MGKRDKEHRKRVAKRNENIKVKEKQIKKIQQKMLMELIEKEKQKGLFDNIEKVSNDIDEIDGPEI